jgi:hypothetical protein
MPPYSLILQKNSESTVCILDRGNPAYCKNAKKKKKLLTVWQASYTLLTQPELCYCSRHGWTFKCASIMIQRISVV